jgi:MoxR-like ATPase
MSNMSEHEISEIGGKLIKTVNFVDEHGYLKKSLAILRQVGNLRLVGETGTGKTTLTYAIAQKTKLPLYETVLTRDTSRWDLLACDTLKEGSSQVRKGLVVKWLEATEGGILYLDGFNYGDNGVVALIESLADFRGNVWIPELEKTFTRTANHYIIISYNPTEKTGYSGTFMQNIATIRRFEGLVIDYLSETEEKKLLKDVSGNYEFSAKFVSLANKTRKLYRESKLRTPLTTGNLINYGKLFKAKELDEDEIIVIASSLYPEDEISMFKRLYEESAKIDLRKVREATEKEAGEQAQTTF